MRILLLDPDEYYHQQFHARMGQDFDVIPARSLESAKKILSEKKTDLLLAELLLEDGASFSIIKELRMQRDNSAVPVVIFSQIDNLEDIEAALSLGVSGYFVKGKDEISDVHRLLL